MELTEIRNKIDALDEEIKALLLQRLACSKEVAEAKAEKAKRKFTAPTGRKPFWSASETMCPR